MKALIPLANGCEEMEAVILIDILRRADWTVTAAGLTDGIIDASRGVRLVPDTTWDAIDPADYDLLLLPGGMDGTLALCEHDGVQQALRTFHSAGKWMGAICAAPLALQTAGILNGRPFTCYPGIEQQMPPSVAAGWRDEAVVVDGRLITSQGPGTAFDFSLKVIAECSGASTADAVRKGLLL